MAVTERGWQGDITGADAFVLAVDLLAHGVIGHQRLDDGPGGQPGHHKLLGAA
jgi:hypothetical protein